MVERCDEPWYNDEEDLWDTGELSKRDREIIESSPIKKFPKDVWDNSSMHTVPPSNSMYQPKFEWEADPDDHWDTGKDKGYNPIGNFVDYRKIVDKIDTQKCIHQPSINSLGRRIRKMSKEFSIPIIPLLVVGWLLFGGDDEEKTEVTDTEKPAIVDQVKEIASDAIDKVQPMIEEAKTKLETDKKVVAEKPKGGGDPYATDDKYGSTDDKW